MRPKPKSMPSLVLALSAVTVLLIGLCNWKWVVGHAALLDDSIMQILTIVAFILAFRAYFEAKNQGEKLRSIYESVDTKYVDVFPKHLGLLIDHIGQANDFVCILWDAVDIGSYVYPSYHDRLVSELIKAADRIARNESELGGVRFLLWGKPKAISQAGVNVLNKDKAKEFCVHVSKKEEFIKQLPILLQKYKNTEKGNTVCDNDLIPFINSEKPIDFSCKNMEIFFQVFQLCYHDYIANLLGKKISVRINEKLGDHSIPSANFFWISDNGKGGVHGGFLLLTPGEAAPAFCTSDPNLTNTLKYIFDSNFNKALPYV